MIRKIRKFIFKNNLTMKVRFMLLIAGYLACTYFIEKYVGIHFYKYALLGLVLLLISKSK